MSQFLNSKSLCLSVFVSQNEPKICRHQLPVTHHMPPAFGRQSHAWQQRRLSAERQPRGKGLQQEGGFGVRQDCAGRNCSQAGRRSALPGEPLNRRPLLGCLRPQGDAPPGAGRLLTARSRCPAVRGPRSHARPHGDPRPRIGHRLAVTPGLPRASHQSRPHIAQASRDPQAF